LSGPCGTDVVVVVVLFCGPCNLCYGQQINTRLHFPLGYPKAINLMARHASDQKLADASDDFFIKQQPELQQFGLFHQQLFVLFTFYN
jgi:hypothetical protein